MRNPAEWFAFWQTTLAGMINMLRLLGLAGLRLAFLNLIRHSPTIPLISPKAHEHAVHVGAEDFVGVDHDFPLVSAHDGHWSFAAGQAGQGQRRRQE